MIWFFFFGDQNKSSSKFLVLSIIPIDEVFGTMEDSKEAVGSGETSSQSTAPTDAKTKSKGKAKGTRTPRAKNPGEQIPKKTKANKKKDAKKDEENKDKSTSEQNTTGIMTESIVGETPKTPKKRKAPGIEQSPSKYCWLMEFIFRRKENKRKGNERICK